LTISVGRCRDDGSESQTARNGLRYNYQKQGKNDNGLEVEYEGMGYEYEAESVIRNKSGYQSGQEINKKYVAEEDEEGMTKTDADG